MSVQTVLPVSLQALLIIIAAIATSHECDRQGTSVERHRAGAIAGQRRTSLYEVCSAHDAEG